jgi:hypothetical protein
MGRSPMVSRCLSGHQRSGYPPGCGVLAGAGLRDPIGWLRALKAGCSACGHGPAPTYSAGMQGPSADPAAARRCVGRGTRQSARQGGRGPKAPGLDLSLGHFSTSG